MYTRVSVRLLDRVWAIINYFAVKSDTKRSKSMEWKRVERSTLIADRFYIMVDNTLSIQVITL